MRDSKVYIDDIKDAIKRIEEYTKGITFASFENNQMLVDAVIRNPKIFQLLRKIIYF